VSENSLTRCRPLLGTFVEISLKGVSDRAQLIAYSILAFDEIERIHHLLGFHNPDSELTRLNKKLLSAPLKDQPLSIDMVNVLTLALTIHQQSLGFFDVTIADNLINTKLLPNHFGHIDNCVGNSADLTLTHNTISSKSPVCIDLGGIAKGYAVDCALALVPSSVRCTINAGGDLKSNDWQNQWVHVKYAQRESALRKKKMLQQAVATSGTYYHDDHSAIINPITATEHKFKGCVSVFSSSAMLSDALTKAVILMPSNQAKKLLRVYNAHAILTNRFGFSRTIR